jgi:tetratricopeptide (TPR) repeat protein
MNSSAGGFMLRATAVTLAILFSGSNAAHADDATICGTAITAPDHRLVEVIGACNRVIPIAKTVRDSALFYRYRAWALSHKGEMAEAIVDFDRALAINPDDTWSLQGRAQAHRALGHFDEARDDYLRLEWLYPDTRWRVALEELGLPVEPTMAEVAARPPVVAPAVVRQAETPSVTPVSATAWRPEAESPDSRRLKMLEDENLRLKNLLAEAMLEVAKLRETLAGM